MYKVTADGAVLYDPRVEDTAIFSPKITLEDNLAASFNFTVYPNHPSYSTIQRLKTIIEVYDDEHLLFRGRVLNDELGWNNDKHIVCEGELAYFNDSVVRPYTWQGSLNEYLAMLISNHNLQVEPERQFTLRTITVTDPNDYITRASSDYPSTWSEIVAKLINLLGGHLVLEHLDGVTYLDYIEDSLYQTGQKIELGKNLLDLKRTVRGEDIATAIIPLGATVDDGDSETTDSRLTIASVTEEGRDYVFDQNAVDAYGWIFKTVTFDDVTLAENLLDRGTAALAESIQAQASIEISAIDLSLIDKTIDDFRMLEYVEAVSEPHGLHDKFLIKKMEVDLVTPANNKLTLGRDYGVFTGQTSDTQDRVERIEANYVKGVDVVGIKNDVQNVYSSINQSADAIVAQVGQEFVRQNDYDAYVESTNTQLEQTAEAFTFSFNTLAGQIEAVDSEAMGRLNQLSSYIRFENGDIILGEAGNELTLQLQNDRIRFMQSGVEVAYFSDSKMHIQDAEIGEGLKIGVFAFKPRANGNLSFMKVGG
jgi:hypothetical protein